MNEAARANLWASQYGRDAIRLSITGLVASTYLNLRALDAQLAVSEMSLQSRQESAELVKTRVAAPALSRRSMNIRQTAPWLPSRCNTPIYSVPAP